MLLVDQVCTDIEKEKCRFCAMFIMCFLAVLYIAYQHNQNSMAWTTGSSWGLSMPYYMLEWEQLLLLSWTVYTVIADGLG